MTGTFAHANNGHREKFKRTWRTPREHPTARDKREPKAWIPCKAPNPSRQGEQGLSLFPTTWWKPRGEETKDADSSGKEIIEGRRPEFLAQSWDNSLFPEIQALSFHIGPGHSCGTQEIVVRLQWRQINGMIDTNYSRKHCKRNFHTTEMDCVRLHFSLHWAEPFHIKTYREGSSFFNKTIFGLGRELCSRAVLPLCSCTGQRGREKCMVSPTGWLPEHTMAPLGQVLLLEPQAGMESGVCSKGGGCTFASKIIRKVVS